MEASSGLAVKTGRRRVLGVHVESGLAWSLKAATRLGSESGGAVADARSWPRSMSSLVPFAITPAVRWAVRSSPEFATAWSVGSRTVPALGSGPPRLGEAAAVDRDVVAGDERTRVRRKERDGAGGLRRHPTRPTGVQSRQASGSASSGRRR